MYREFVGIVVSLPYVANSQMGHIYYVYGCYGYYFYF